MQQKIAFVNVVFNILLLTYCLLVVFAPCLQPKVSVISHVYDSYRAGNCSFLVKPIIQIELSISSAQHSERNCYFTDFFITRCRCGNCQSMWREKENIFCREVDVVKNKNLEDVILEQQQAEARCIVQHPWFEETDEG